MVRTLQAAGEDSGEGGAEAPGEAGAAKSGRGRPQETRPEAEDSRGPPRYAHPQGQGCRSYPFSLVTGYRLHRGRQRRDYHKAVQNR